MRIIRKALDIVRVLVFKRGIIRFRKNKRPPSIHTDHVGFGRDDPDNKERALQELQKLRDKLERRRREIGK